MLLLTGPAGSGKTTFVLDRFREALRAGNESIRLLVPTATLEQHLQNRVAREGFVFRRGLIQTLSSFVGDWAGEARQVPETTLYLMVEAAARRVNRPEFARVVQLPGFCASLARTIEEFSSAGCDSARLASQLPDSPLAAAFLAVYRELERELDRRGFAMRARRLELAAERIAAGAERLPHIWMDGFHALPDPELRVIEALSRHADVTLTLGDGDATDELRARLKSKGFREERTTRRRTTPAMTLAPAGGIERESEEIARRILEHAAGRPFREMGIIVRAGDTYAPVLRAVLERFGIPARFYFDQELETHAVVRFLTGAVDAMLGGWEHQQTLAVLRLAPRFADSNALDRLAFDVREHAPDSGLGAMKALLLGEEGQPLSPGAERLLHKLDALSALEEWRSFSLTAPDWTCRFRTLRNFFRPSTHGVATPEAVQVWRSQAAVLDLFDEAVEEAAAALDSAHPMGLEEFWGAVKSALRVKPLRLADERRNVVHVLSAPEARQWSLPIVFVCGMVEKQFPQFHRQDPFFPDDARRRLHAAGIRVRTVAEFEREERSLFDAAASRATMQTIFTYPEFDTRGERNLPSLYLEGLELAHEPARLVRPQPRHTPAPRGPAEIRTPGLLDFLRQRTERVSPSGLERFLNCPFQFFGEKTLKLRPIPPRPEERLSFREMGSIVHATLARWYGTGQAIEDVFESVFAETCEAERIPVCYQTERMRNAMLDDLRNFELTDQWPRAGFQSRMEEGFQFHLDGSVEVSGKIDRLDTGPDGRAYVIDYKYSPGAKARKRLSDENLLQAPLYLMAAEKVFGVKPAGMFYVGLKGGKAVYAGWSETGMLDSIPVPPNWLENAAERTLRIVGEIRGGRMAPEPANPDNCRWCDYRDVCRVEAKAAAETAEAEGA